MTGAGLITTEFQVSISMLTQAGEHTTETIIGTDTRGTTNGSLTDGFNRTGRAGMIIDTGKGEGPGVSRVINLDRSHRSGK
jgi:hypothetical protein